MKLASSGQVFRKIHKYKISRKFVELERINRRTDIPDEANNLFSKFYENT